MARVLIALALVAALVFAYGAFQKGIGGEAVEESIRIGGAEVNATIVDTPEARARGLSGRDVIGENEGMLFVFDVPDRHGIWMKGMRFPIDILWISEGMRVVHVANNVAPETYPDVFYPPQAARYVLELPAGFADAHAIGVGSSLQL